MYGDDEEDDDDDDDDGDDDDDDDGDAGVEEGSDSEESRKSGDDGEGKTSYAESSVEWSDSDREGSEGSAAEESSANAESRKRKERRRKSNNRREDRRTKKMEQVEIDQVLADIGVELPRGYSGHSAVYAKDNPEKMGAVLDALKSALQREQNWKTLFSEILKAQTKLDEAGEEDYIGNLANVINYGDVSFDHPAWDEMSVGHRNM
jgi:hypothetical protein